MKKMFGFLLICGIVSLVSSSEVCLLRLQDPDLVRPSGYVYYRFDKNVPEEDQNAVKKLMKHIETELESDEGQSCVTFKNTEFSNKKNKDFELLTYNEGRDFRQLDQLLSLLGFIRDPDVGVSGYDEGGYDEGGDDCDTGELSVLDVVEIALAYRCPVKTRTLLAYADLTRDQCLESARQQGTSSPGRPGLRGIPGDPGYTGLPGLEGDKGFMGFKGSIGMQGLPGLQGEIGAPGGTEKGNKGIMGTAGTREGEQGHDGMSGGKGQRGDFGVPGLPGLMGPKGGRGEVGMSNGRPGLPGEHGDEGRRGQKGDTGHSGYDGLSGIMGDHGPCPSFDNCD